MTLKEICEQEALKQIQDGHGIGSLPTIRYLIDLFKGEKQ